ncbi:histidine kinase 1-like [Dorcoceras hygrometricum]|uniref:Histidine kinase 1-like n=1 Tax=Dorcoceras hygrometricum TaxID=472368 RepID=A0A2Z6ZTQ4_9LAMI|nr:histidine kinase 1-like [Dorcoceras hygrometricum]
MNSQLRSGTVNSQERSGTVNSQLRSETVNSALIGQLSFGLVNSALDWSTQLWTRQLSFGKVNSAHEFQQAATRVTNQITSRKPIVLPI